MELEVLDGWELLALQGPEGDSEKWKQKHRKSRKEVEGNTERTPEGVMRAS